MLFYCRPLPGQIVSGFAPRPGCESVTGQGMAGVASGQMLDFSKFERVTDDFFNISEWSRRSTSGRLRHLER